MELKNKTALVTGAGATGGIGFQIASSLYRAGVKLIITGRDLERGTAAAAMLGPDVRFMTADLTNIDEVNALAHDAGAVDILVNNAADISYSSTLEQSSHEFDAVFKTNVRGPYFLTAALAPHMIAARRGSIINISTVVASRPSPGLSVYGASKAALESLTRSWASEFAHAGVRVNTVAPGATASETVLASLGENVENVAKTIPLGRMGRTMDIAEAVLFLASERSQFVTGALLPVDGGYSVV